MMRSWWRGLVPLLCGAVVLCSRPVGAQVVTPAEVESGSVIVTAETAEVRVGPSADFEVITVVGRGEIFPKLGRTGAWYYLQINGETFGWVSGRAISRYREGEPAPPPVSSDEEQRDEGRDPYYPYYPNYPSYYPGLYYDYSFYSWGWPYYSWDSWYYYSGNRYYGRRGYDHGGHYEGPRNDYRRGRGNSYRNGGSGRHIPSPPRPALPRIGPRSPRR